MLSAADRREHGVDGEVLVTNGSMQADAFLFATVATHDVSGDYDRTLRPRRGERPHGRARGRDRPTRSPSCSAAGQASLAHIIPNFQNPAGYTLSLDKRERLLELAAEYDFAIFEDDPYVDIRFSGEPLPTMLSLDADDRVVYASSFSKTVCPGIRVGYLVGPAT